jgi:hypothetical protein
MFWDLLPGPAKADPNYDPENALQSGVYARVLQLWAPQGDPDPALANLATGFAVVARAKQDYAAFAARHAAGPAAALVKTTADALDAAFAALDVYLYDSIAALVPDGYRRIADKASLAKLGLAGVRLSDDASGFYSAVYAKGPVGAEGTRYLVANRGTDDGFLSFAHGIALSLDAVADFDENFGFKNAQYDEAADAARAIAAAADKTKGSVVFTGHSLGGGLASAQAAATGRRAYTFNASGARGAGGAAKQITAYVYRGNWLDNLQRDGFAVGPIGKTVDIDHLQIKPRAAYDNANDWHLLNFVIPGMLGMLRSGRLTA